MGAIINKYKASGNLVLDLPFNQGTLNDKSGYGNNATAPTGVSWQNMRKMRALKTSGTGGIVVADSVSMRYTEATITLLFGRGLKSATQRIYCHRDVAGYRLDFYQSGLLTIGTALGTSSFTYTITGNERTMTIKMFADARRPQLYVNGIFIGEGDAGLAMGTTNAALTIGNYYSGATQATTSPIAHVVAINTTSVTNQEIAQLHEELSAEVSFGEPKTDNFKFPYPVESDSSCIFDLDMTIKGADGKLTDVKGGRRFTPTKGPVLVPGGFNGGQNVHNGAYFISTEYDAMFFAGSYTFETVVKLHSASAVAGILGNSAGTAHYCGTSGIGRMFLSFVNGSGVQVTKSGAALLPLNTELHLVYVLSVSGSDVTVTTYINGVLDATETFSGVGFTAGVSLQKIIGSFYTLSTFSDSVIYLARYFTKAMTAQEVAARYKNHAKLLRKRECFCKAPVTLANVTSGKIGNTSFSTTTGSWAVSEDTTSPYKRWLKCVSNGIVGIKSTKAYGTWVFDVYHADNSATDILFIASDMAARNGATQSAYTLNLIPSERVQLEKNTPGTSTDLAYTPPYYFAAETAYRFVITRKYNGQFSVYIKGGAFTNWTLVSVAGGGGANPSTDNEITTSKYIVLNFAAGDKFSNLQILEGVIDPTVSGIPE